VLIEIGVGSGNLLKNNRGNLVDLHSDIKNRMSSVLGLGAAGLGAAAMGASSLGGKNKQKKVSVPQPSSQDYLNSFMTTISNQKLSDKQRAKALFGGPIKSVSGDFYYGGPPKKIPEGAFVVQGQPLTQGARTRNEGYYTREIDTYQVISPQVKEKPRPQEQAPQLRLDLSQGGGRVDRLNTKDIKHAVAEGASMKDIRQAAKSQDIRTSAKAKSMLQKSKKKDK
jgi:hypothetical protein